MSSLRSLMVLGLAGSMLWLATLAAQETPPAKAVTPAQPPAPKPDATATQTLNQAIERADPRQLPWAEMELWQQVSGNGAAFQAQGRYLLGPDYRRRVDLKVHIGNIEGTLEIVCDGTTLWQAMHIGNYGRMISKTDFKKAFDVLNGPGLQPMKAEQTRQEFLQQQSLAGLWPLLKSLRDQLVFTKQETGRWNGREMTILVGVWTADLAKAIAPPDRWPPGLPRTCRLYLEKETLWPYRLEWWGPALPQREDSLLLQMEFRNPKLGKPGEKPPAHFATAFTFEPGNDPVADQTKETSEGLKQRAQQLATQKAPTPGTPSTPAKP